MSGSDAGTPSSRWAVNGEPDPHGNTYDCERTELAMGDYTDDELANAVFLHGNERPSITDIETGKALPAIAYLMAAKDRIRWLSRRLASVSVPAPSGGESTFQGGVSAWMGECFPPAITHNRTERGDRLLEEVLELLQSHGYDRGRVATLVDYTYGRPVGEPAQEVGGVMVTLAAYCMVTGLDMRVEGDRELARITQPEVMAKIRRKQEAKRALHFDSPLPGAGTRMPEPQA